MSFKKDKKVVLRNLKIISHCVAVEDLYPVVVRILDEGETLHLPILRLLDKLHPHLLEPPARGVHVGHHHADVAEAPGVGVAVVVGGGPGLGLRAPVVGELEGGLLLETPPCPLLYIQYQLLMSL